MGYLEEGSTRDQFGQQSIQLPEDSDAYTIDVNDAMESSIGNISMMDKRQWYQYVFMNEWINIVERKNAKELQKQARVRWYRVRVIAKWMRVRIRRFAKYLRR